MKLVTGVVALLAASCACAQLPGMPGTLPESSSNVRFQTVGSGDSLATNSPGLYVLDEPVSWSNYWRANHRGPMPNLEAGFFYNWRLVAIHAGTRPTAGYGLTVMRMDRRIDRATISAVETVPMRGSRNAAVATSPWILLRVERGAFGFDLQTRQVASQYGTVPGGTVVKTGGVTIIMTGSGGCDHCAHRGREGCRCGGGAGCTCKG